MTETCWMCETGGWPRLVRKDESVPLCKRHWARWLIRWVNADDEAPCGAHLIPELGGSRNG